MFITQLISFEWKLRDKNAYLQKLGELCVAEVLVSFMAEVESDELTVPVEGNVVMNCGLAEDVAYILWKSKTAGDKGKNM